MLRVQHARLTDPRRFVAATTDPLVRWAEASLAAERADPGAIATLTEQYRSALRAQDDDTIGGSFRAATSPAVYRCLWECLNFALQSEGDEPPDVRVQPFAIPLLVIAGGVVEAALPGALPDVSRVRAILEGRGLLGQTRNFGLSNALVDAGALAAVPPSRIYRLMHEMTNGLLDLPPAPMTVIPTAESVHLRYLLGAALIPAHAPSFLETGSAISTWGMALTQELADQLGGEGITVLPIPRPPANLLQAQEEGRGAREELAFQAFVSRVVRGFRAEVGDPEATISALDSCAIGVRFTSPFIHSRVEVHVRGLHPLDDLTQVQAAIVELLRECRIERVEVLRGIADADEFGRNPAARGNQ